MNKLAHVKGLAELQKLLDELPAKLEANVMRGALRSGMNVYKAEAKRNINNVSGDLAKALKVGTRIEKNLGAAIVKSNLAAKGFEGYKAMWVEFGTNPHLISVADEDKMVNKRASLKAGRVVKESMTSVNRRVLAIGGNFVGPTLQHPGAKPHPFLRPAFDAKSDAALMQVAKYIKRVLSTKHGIQTAHINLEGDA